MINWGRVFYLLVCFIAVALQFTAISTNFWNKCQFEGLNNQTVVPVASYTHGLWRECREYFNQTDVQCYDNPWIVEKEPRWSKVVKALAVISCMTIFFAALLSFLQLFTKSILIPSPFFSFMSGVFMLCTVSIYAHFGLGGQGCTNYRFGYSFATGCAGAGVACMTCVFGVVVYHKELNTVNSIRDH